MTQKPIYIENDNLITLTGLKNSLLDTYITDATVVVTVKDENGDTVTGSSWPLTMDYVAGTDGTYRVILPEALVLTKNVRYVAEVKVDSSDLDALFKVPLVAKYRER